MLITAGQLLTSWGAARRVPACTKQAHAILKLWASCSSPACHLSSCPRQLGCSSTSHARRQRRKQCSINHGASTAGRRRHRPLPAAGPAAQRQHRGDHAGAALLRSAMLTRTGAHAVQAPHAALHARRRTAASRACATRTSPAAAHPRLQRCRPRLRCCATPAGAPRMMRSAAMCASVRALQPQQLRRPRRQRRARAAAR